MNTTKTALFAAALSLSISTALLAKDSPPPILAGQAAQIAQTDLESRGLADTIFIEQIVFKKKSAINGEAHWEILWSNDFPAQTKGRKEYAIRILMSGEYKRAVH
tara:strand:- start:1719 stop:2033 length:315 start_codon:yes stop_codon:yes gene_type:complete